MPEAAIYSLNLPRSGVIVQWRDDDTYRLGKRDTVEQEAFEPVNFRSTDSDSFPFELRQQAWPGDSDQPTWWLIISAARLAASVAAFLADGSPVPVHRLGTVILCEWESHPQDVVFDVDHRSHVIRPFRAPSQPPPRHPFPSTGSAAGGDAWVDYSRVDER